MDKAIRFWRDLLDMRLVAGLGQPGYRHYFFEFSKTDLLAFFECPGVKPVQEEDHGQPVSGPFIFDHVSFGVETEEDLWALKDKLSAAGFWVSDVIDHGFIHSIYAFDPNGMPIEFSHNAEDVDVRKDLCMKDTVPSAAAWEELTPPSSKVATSGSANTKRGASSLSGCRKRTISWNKENMTYTHKFLRARYPFSVSNQGSGHSVGALQNIMLDCEAQTEQILHGFKPCTLRQQTRSCILRV